MTKNSFVAEVTFNFALYRNDLALLQDLALFTCTEMKSLAHEL